MNKTLSTAQKNYFNKMLSQLENNKLQEPDLYQLYQDMVNTNYVWDKPDLALYARMLIEKGLVTAPFGYVHRQVDPNEVLKMQQKRESKNNLLH